MTKNEVDNVLEDYVYNPCGDEFEESLGPFLSKEEANGMRSCAVQSDHRHANGMGILHGGFLMTFADFALFEFAGWDPDNPSVTIAFNSEFISAGKVGDVVIARGECTRRTKSIMFARGSLMVGDETLMTFSGVLKRIRI